jgi:hypothetical protein
LLLAAALIAFVASSVPWSDSLSWKQDQVSHTVKGRIVGDWKAEEVLFEPRQADRAPPGLAGQTAWRVRRGTASRSGAAQQEELSWNPGLPRLFADLRPGLLAAALLCVVLSLLVTSARWWRLLAAANCPASYVDALRLTSLGFFFNLVVPGLTGGDLVKAVLVAREHPERRAAAAVSVFVDRIVGLLALVLLGAGAVFASGERFAFLRWPLLGVLLLASLGAWAYGHPRLRAAVPLERWLARLPLGGALHQLDRAFLLYSREPLAVAGAFALSFVNHVSVVATFLILGAAFGEDVLTWPQYVIAVSVGNTATAVPLAPGGWGVGEFIFGSLFAELGASRTLGIAISVGYRLILCSVGLAGGLFLLAPGARERWREASALAPEGDRA